MIKKVMNEDWYVLAYRVKFIWEKRTEQGITLLRRIANCFKISRIKSKNWADATSTCTSEPTYDTHCRRGRSRMILRYQSQQASALQPQRRATFLGKIF